MSLFRTFSLTFCGAGALAASAAAAPTAAPTRVPLPLRPPTIISLSQPLGATSTRQTIGLAISLPMRDQAGAKQLLHDLYAPGSPSYHKYLTTAQFTARFGPAQSDYDAVVAFAKSQGLTVTKTFPERTLLDVSGPASAVQTAFAVALKNYESPSGRIFYAPVGKPSIPAALGGKIASVVGLDNAQVRYPNMRRLVTHSLAEQPQDGQGTGVGGGLAPKDIRTAYNLDTLSQNGAGQTLAVFELDTYSAKDILRYERQFGLPVVPLENVLVDTSDNENFPDFPGSGTGEVVLDIDMQIALAPKAAKVLVYIGPNTSQGVVDQYQQIATDNRATSISTSWAIPEDAYFDTDAFPEGFAAAFAAYLVPEYNAFAQMAMQGQSIFASAGDSGGVDTRTGNLSTQDPSSQPFMCGVGGTTLTVKNPGIDEHYVSETTWNATGNPSQGAGGGGVSYIWNIPDYQVAAASLADPNAQVAADARNVPDISLNSDPASGYTVFVSDPATGPAFYVYGGTSAAAPLWAGYTALVNQKRASLGKGPIGFINPALYQLGPGGTFASRYGSDFHDIADGSDNIPYPALKGYDLATGLGTFNGANLLNDLATKF